LQERHFSLPAYVVRVPGFATGDNPFVLGGQNFLLVNEAFTVLVLVAALGCGVNAGTRYTRAVKRWARKRFGKQFEK
jgi:hypothetical protein